MSGNAHEGSAASTESLSEPDTIERKKRKGPTEGENEDKGTSAGAGIGSLLRKEREKKSLSYVQVSDRIRIRPYILEALENENWEALPSPVFVTGFLRSYARTLGLEQEKVVSLYSTSAHAETTPNARPLVEPLKRRKLPFFILIFLLLASASAYYLWMNLPTPMQSAPGPQTIEFENEKLRGPADTEELRHEPGPGLSNEITKEAVGPVKIEPRQGPALLDEKPESGLQNDDLESPGLLPEGTEVSLTSSTERKPSREETGIPQEGTISHTLKAFVRERTYIKVVVDAQEPKEYIFPAGSAPQWKAMESIHMVIGNAGGIDLDFNGTRIENLGRHGQVVRLRLPEDSERRNLQD